MSCKKDRDLQAAIALGLLWGMNQVSSRKEGLDARVERMRLLLDYVGLNLPVQADPPLLRIGAGWIKQKQNGVCLCSAGDGVSVTQDHKDTLWAKQTQDGEVLVSGSKEFVAAKNYQDAIWHVLRKQVRDAASQALAGVEPIHPPFDVEKVQSWLKQCEQAVSAQGGPFAGALLRFTATTTPTTMNVQAYVQESHDSAATIGYANHYYAAGMAETSNEGVAQCLEYLVGNLLQRASELEPYLGVQANDSLSESLFSSGYLNLAYVDESTAKTLGGQTKKGWYVVRDNKLYKGPMRSPKDAATWVNQEWGADVAKYAQIAHLNDQRRAIRETFEQEVEKLKNSPMDEKARQAAFRHLAEQSAFSTKKMLSPYIVGEIDAPITGKHGKSFILKGKDGKLFRVSVSAVNKKMEGLLTWRVHEHDEKSGTGNMLQMGHEYAMLGYQNVAHYQDVHNVLGNVVSQMILKDLLPSLDTAK